jgi:hypothetical protein
MGDVKAYEHEKLIVCVLYSDEAYLSRALALLTDAFGPVDLASDAYPFSHVYSTYYDEELGGRAVRRLYSFETCLDPSGLADIKLLTASFENRLSSEGKRRVNLDPGFIGPGRLVLASTKNAGHRIPLSGGIYAELTLFYARSQWNAFPWTYLDFQSDAVQKFLIEVRRLYIRRLRLRQGE